MKFGKRIGQRLGRAQNHFSRDLEAWMDRNWSTKTEWYLFVGVVATLVMLAYLWSSSECAMGRECLIANPDLANWLFGAK